MATFNPIGKFILVLLDPPATLTAGSIHLANPRVKPDEPAWGQAIEVGAGVQEVKQGDRVLTTPHQGYRYRAAGNDYLVLPERHVMAREYLDAAPAAG